MLTDNHSRPAILFDLDGTLVDTVYQHVHAWSRAFNKFGITLPSWEIHRRIGMSGHSMIQQVLRKYKPKGRPVNMARLEGEHDAAFAKAIKSIRPLPGAQELLRHLDRTGVAWAIATTGGNAATRRLLKVLKVPTPTVVTGDDVKQAKPSPDVFVEAASRLNAGLEQCIVVGDSVWDTLAGVRGKALAVGLLSGGYSKDELNQAGAFRVYADPAEMLDSLEDLGLQK